LGMSLGIQDKLIKFIIETMNQPPKSSLVVYLALLFSAISIVVSIFAIWIAKRNTDRTIDDKRVTAIVESLSELLAIFNNPLDDKKWGKLIKKEHVSEDHLKLETRLYGLLQNNEKDKKLLMSIKTVREQSDNENGLKANIINLRTKFEEWKDE
jgi:flagellar biosynthesis component FlhA